MKTLLILAVLAQAADTASTCVGLSRGYVEANPLLPSTCAGIATVKSAVVVAAIPASIWVHRQRPTLTKWIVGAAQVVVPAVAAIHNIRAMR